MGPCKFWRANIKHRFEDVRLEDWNMSTISPTIVDISDLIVASDYITERPGGGPGIFFF